MKRRPAGFSLVELLAAMALLGAIVLIGASLTTGVLKHMSNRDPNADRWAVALGALPQLREDLRRSDALPGRVAGLRLPPGSLVLDRSGGRAERVVVWQAEDGRLSRTEYQREGLRMTASAERVWPGAFAASLRIRRGEGGGRRLVELDVAGAGPPVHFVFGVRE
jgi:prepilin-type N-terminal cleavage/methylation domain-containing protein